MKTETIILQNLIKNNDYVKKVLPHLKSEYFTDTNDKLIYNIVSEYILKYNVQPKLAEIELEIQSRKGLSQDQVNHSVKAIREIDNAKAESNTDWLVDTTENFCKEKAIYNAMLKSMEVLQGKDNKLTKAAIPDILSEALGVSFDPDIGHDYFADSEKQYDYYHKVENRIRFDLDILNEITDGGIPDKTLSVALAGVHIGKTLLMCHLAAGFLSQGYDVLYITLEMKEEEITKRIDANLMNVPFSDLDKMPKPDYMKKASFLKSKTNGKLIVKEYPTTTASSLHFRLLLDDLKLKKGFKPHIVFVDYINLCQSARFKPGSAGMYEYVKAIAEELRGLAGIYKTRFFTATQVNREGFKSSQPDMTNTAESFGLPATADLMFSMVVNDQLKQLNQLLFIQLKNRFGDMNKITANGTSLNKFLVGIDRSKFRLYDLENPHASLIMPNTPEVKSEQAFGGNIKDKFKKLKV